MCDGFCGCVLKHKTVDGNAEQTDQLLDSNKTFQGPHMLG